MMVFPIDFTSVAIINNNKNYCISHILTKMGKLGDGKDVTEALVKAHQASLYD